MTDLRNRIPPSGPFTTDLSRPIIGTGGDISQAQDVVPPSTTTELETSVLDTTGTLIAGAIVIFTACVQLASDVAAAHCSFDLTLDGSPVAPVPLGQLLQQDVSGAAPIVTVAFSGVAILTPAGAHTLKVRCVTDSHTTATVNPTGAFGRTLTLLFFK